MKKIISLFVSFLFVQIVAAQKEPIVMEINGKSVTKSEFLQIYLKNNNDPKYDKQTLDDYVEMFKKFKLKVAEAETLGYDTIPKLKKELSIPESTAIISPLTRLNSGTLAFCSSLDKCFSFIIPALPEMAIPIRQTSTPISTRIPPWVDIISVNDTFPGVGLML